MTEILPRLRATGRVAILVSRYNELITSRLLEGARAACRDAGLAEGDLDVVWLPGAYELATVYTAGLGARAALSSEANVLIALLTGAETASAREKSGFEQVE